MIDFTPNPKLLEMGKELDAEGENNEAQQASASGSKGLLPIDRYSLEIRLRWVARRARSPT